MRDQHYKNKTMRVADKTWEQLKEKRRRSGKSWNLYILSLLKPKAQKDFGQKDSIR